MRQVFSKDGMIAALRAPARAKSIASGGRGDRDDTVRFGDVVEHPIKFTREHTASSSLCILYTDSLVSVEAWIVERLAEREGLFFGLDTESRPNFSGGAPEDPMVLQLSTLRHACVFQMNASKAALTEASAAAPLLYGLLFPLASNATPLLLGAGAPAVPLIGMGVRQDLIALEKVFGFRLDGDSLYTASKEAAKQIRRTRHPHALDLDRCKSGGLLAIAQSLTGVAKWKSKSLQMSQWQKFPLARSRVAYAAMDAWAGAAVYHYYIINPPFPPPIW
jgi:hypothetical protein